MRKFSENEQKTYDTLLNSLATAPTPEMIVAAMDNIERFLKIVDAFGVKEPASPRVPSVFDRNTPYYVPPASCNTPLAEINATTTARRKTDG